MYRVNCIIACMLHVLWLQLITMNHVDDVHVILKCVSLQVLFHHQAISVPAVIKQLVSQLNRSSGEVIKKRPRLVMKGFYVHSYVIIIKLTIFYCVHVFIVYIIHVYKV